MEDPPGKLRVLVTGASGKTGALVVRELLKRPADFDVRVTVRSDKAHKLMLQLGVQPGAVYRADVAAADPAALRVALTGAHALVMCTSAVPEVKWLPTLLGGLRVWARGLCRSRRGGQDAAADELPFVPVATWRGGQTPEAVDFRGAVAQVDAARAAGGVRHVVLVSSAGGCDPKHFLNYIGRDGGGGGGSCRCDILNWKRRAEQHLVASGLPFTILHPNHLVDAAGPGRHELVLGVDDALQAPHWRNRLKMPRGDLALLAVCCLLLRDEGAGNRSIDCAARPCGGGAGSADAGAGGAGGGGGVPTTTVEQVRELLAQMPRDCDYRINDRTAPGAVFACAR